MKKRQRGRKLSRERDQRKALLRSLAANFFWQEKIRTTEAKAKEIAPFIEKLISRAKENSLHSQRLILKFLPSQTTQKLIKEIAPKYKERKGGYTRIVKLGQRKSDGAKMAIIELVK